MTSLSFSAETPKQYFQDLQHHFADTNDSAQLVVFKKGSASGFAYYCGLETDLAVLFEQHQGTKYIRIQQSPTLLNGRLVLRLIKTNAQISIYDPKLRVLKPSGNADTNFYLLCTSENIGFELAPPKGNSEIRIQVLTLVLSRDYLVQNFNASHELHWPLLSNWLKKYEAVIIRKTLNQLISNQLEQLFETAALGNNTLLVRRDMYDLLMQILDLNQKSNDNIKQHDWDVLTEIHDIIMHDLTKAPSIKELADVAQMSVSKLKTIFYKRYKEPIYTYFLNARLAKAKALLETGRYTVGQVSLKMGYSQTTKFIVPFKKRYKTTPFTFRKSGNK